MTFLVRIEYHIYHCQPFCPPSLSLYYKIPPIGCELAATVDPLCLFWWEQSFTCVLPSLLNLPHMMFPFTYKTFHFHLYFSKRYKFIKWLWRTRVFHSCLMNLSESESRHCWNRASLIYTFQKSINEVPDPNRTVVYCVMHCLNDIPFISRLFHYEYFIKTAALQISRMACQSPRVSVYKQDVEQECNESDS